MTAHPSTMPAQASDPLSYVRYVDLALLVLAAPFVVAMGAPVLGFAVGAVAYAAQRIAGELIERKARTLEFKSGVFLGLASSLGRSWTTAIAILAVGLAAERADGLTAGITVLAAFTVYFAVNLIIRPLERKK